MRFSRRVIALILAGLTGCAGSGARSGTLPNAAPDTAGPRYSLGYWFLVKNDTPYTLHVHVPRSDICMKTIPPSTFTVASNQLQPPYQIETYLLGGCLWVWQESAFAAEFRESNDVVVLRFNKFTHRGWEATQTEQRGALTCHFRYSNITLFVTCR